MANEEQLEILRQGLIYGVEVWNRWREENPDVPPDLVEAELSGADLSGADLSGADLRDADLSAANLSGADLSKADLRGAILRGAILSEADLSEADLVRADLVRADLREADFIRAHLEWADLREADLREADLDGAHLSAANLSGADLFGANFSGANLRQADLFGAHLREANLIRAHLEWADLREADLRRAGLNGANLSEANLSGADFSEATVGNTVFADLDLTVVKGLEIIWHEGPSYIDIHTIYHSYGKIPEAFLRGAGVPDTFIAYIASLTGEAIQYYSCFISYSSRDDDFAKRLHADLQQNNVRCWFAPEDMKIGDKIRLRIDESIRIHDKLLLVLSEHSVASQWVEHEVEHALDLENERETPVLFPIRLDEAVMESKVGWAGNIRRTRHIGDFSRWKAPDSYQRAFDRLLRDLKASEA
jgi:uncharacterized protein YjbI with pentapeptide repeats